ncbi:MAG: 4Fe-4S binding protein [Thermodesulfovibrionales bacterium]|nr:4Fe-4S binding protein [Thermodesulfovibrionales bacterium]
MTEQKEKKVEDIKKEAEENIKCPVNKALYYIREFLAGPMCARCFPCMMGAYEAEIRLHNIVEGKGTETDLAALRRIVDDMLEGSMCMKGKNTAKFILEWMGTDVYREHVEGRCPDTECKAFIEYRIIPEKCIMCGLCQDVCKYNAIIGEKKKLYQSGYRPFEIRQMRCAKCGDCVSVCPTDAIIVVGVKGREPVGV